MSGFSTAAPVLIGLVMCLGLAATAAASSPRATQHRTWAKEMSSTVKVRIVGPLASARWILSFLEYFGEIAHFVLQVDDTGVQVALVTFFHIADALAATEEEHDFDGRRFIITWEGQQLQNDVPSAQVPGPVAWNDLKKPCRPWRNWIRRPFASSEAK
eukprot:TRINITY_DN56494_c0_g1_i1.p2 TRINITY_DN56494_c0_g1~~TRINITY_DN56494_c0_g1_i1.p2  ORF type:complete len:158 (-),score=27.92 TRINITY_DN56494_c0_g1_i1:76-549(-)